MKILSKLSFYRLERVDGEIHTGIEIEGETVLGLLENEAKEPDPVLLWWVDVRCDGRKLPTDPEEARRWLLDHGPTIRRGLQTLAREIDAGVDFDVWPILWPVPKPPRGIRITIACRASRRAEGLDMASVLTGIDEQWEELVQNLRPMLPVTL